jgi:hypothetical protein
MRFEDYHHPSSWALVIIALELSIGLSRNANTIVAIWVFVSLGTTILATAMIIYRIRHFSKGIGSRSGKYNSTIEVLVESGALYAATQLVDCVLLVSRGTAFNAAPGGQLLTFWGGIATPVAVSN